MCHNITSYLQRFKMHVMKNAYGKSTLITLSRFEIGTMDHIISEILRKSKTELRKQRQADPALFNKSLISQGVN